MTKGLAWQPARKGLTLAARRAAFASQMRTMALTELSEVSKRLKSLHAELERKEGHKLTHYVLADKMKIAPRTFQSWENGEVENSDGKGYDKMARYYSRRLGRKITRNWILFGCEEVPPVRSIGVEQTSNDTGADPSQGIIDRLEAIQTQLTAAAADRADMQQRLTEIERLLKRPPSEGTG